MKRLTGLFLAGIIAVGLRAEINVATLNCYLCFSPKNHEEIKIPDIANNRLSSRDYKKKITDLGKLAAGAKPDVIGLEEIGSDIEAADLAKAIQAAWPDGGPWTVCFKQGKDHQTGEDVAALVRTKAATVVDFSRDAALEGLSKHLVTRVRAGTKTFAIVTVHLVRPMNGNEQQHADQIAALAQWIKTHKDGTSVIVVGDFNDTRKGVLPLAEASTLTHAAPTHLDGREYDHIFATKLLSAQVSPPPYGKNPEKKQLSLWTDHFMLSAVVDN